MVLYQNRLLHSQKRKTFYDFLGDYHFLFLIASGIAFAREALGVTSLPEIRKRAFAGGETMSTICCIVSTALPAKRGKCDFASSRWQTALFLVGTIVACAMDTAYGQSGNNAQNYLARAIRLIVSQSAAVLPISRHAPLR